MIAKPRMGRLTQGTIFCGGCAHGYKDSPVWGLVITARCDTAHEKAVVVNYLPVVRVEQWLKLHGGLLILEKRLKELRGKFAALLKKKKLSDSLLDVYEPRVIAADHFPTLGREPENNKERSDEADRESAIAIANEISAIAHALSECSLDAPFSDALLAGKIQSAQAILVDLLGHRLSGYYFLPDIGDLTEYPSALGYVVILREVRSIYRDTARLLVNGLTSEKLNPNNPDLGLSFNPFDFAFPIAELPSPWIEHLLQVFCTMFGRIGVTDPELTKAKTIAESVFSISGAKHADQP